MRKLHHTTPCRECPFRKDSAPGWLGGFTAEDYADPVAMNEPTSCHCTDFGPADERTAFCAGSLSTMANSCTLADDRKAPGSEAARKAVGTRDDTFANVRDFYRHHTDKEYKTPLMRALEDHSA